MSLIQVLVAVGVSSILLTAMTAMTVSQSRENQALTEKLGALDLQRVLTSTLADSAVCTYIVTHGTALTFDASLITPSSHPPPINLGPTLRSTATATGPVVAEIDTNASPISNSLKVSSLELADFDCDGCDVAASNSFNANIRINFDTAKMVRPIQPAASPILLQTSGAGTTKTITGCAGVAASPPPAPGLSGYQVISQWFGVCNAYVPLCCPGSKKLLGGACYSDWGWCSSSAINGQCFYGVAWTGYAGGSQCGSGIQIMITCAD